MTTESNEDKEPKIEVKPPKSKEDEGPPSIISFLIMSCLVGVFFFAVSTGLGFLIFHGNAGERMLADYASSRVERKLWENSPVDSIFVAARTFPRRIVGASMEGTSGNQIMLTALWIALGVSLTLFAFCMVGWTIEKRAARRSKGTERKNGR